MTTRLGFPTFDADNHLYETRDAFTRHLPDRYKGAIDYVDVRGRTKIVVRGRISEYIPNPTFEVVARPGAQEEYFRVGNPEGKSYREIVGEPMRSIPAFREPAARVELMDEPPYADTGAGRVGADHILFGSDYPHPEGLAEPCSYVDHLPDGLADDVVAAVMGGNLGQLMRVEAPTPA
jgi:hypothetical protein